MPTLSQIAHRRAFVSRHSSFSALLTGSGCGCAWDVRVSGHGSCIEEQAACAVLGWNTAGSRWMTRAAWHRCERICLVQSWVKACWPRNILTCLLPCSIIQTPFLLFIPRIVFGGSHSLDRESHSHSFCCCFQSYRIQSLITIGVKLYSQSLLQPPPIPAQKNIRFRKWASKHCQLSLLHCVPSSSPLA
jgi:hypothetical protein